METPEIIDDDEETSFEIVDYNGDYLDDYNPDENNYDTDEDTIKFVTNMINQFRSELDIIKLNPSTFNHKIFDDYVTMITEYDFIIKENKILKSQTDLLKMDIDVCEYKCSEIIIKGLVEEDNAQLSHNSYPIKTSRDLIKKETNDSILKYKHNGVSVPNFDISSEADYTEEDRLHYQFAHNGLKRVMENIDAMHQDPTLYTKKDIQYDLDIVLFKYPNTIRHYSILQSMIDNINSALGENELKPEDIIKSSHNNQNFKEEELDLSLEEYKLDNIIIHNEDGPDVCVIGSSNIKSYLDQPSTITSENPNEFNIDWEYLVASQDDELIPIDKSHRNEYLNVNEKLNSIKNRIDILTSNSTDNIETIYFDLCDIRDTYDDIIADNTYFAGIIGKIMLSIYNKKMD